MTYLRPRPPETHLKPAMKGRGGGGSVPDRWGGGRYLPDSIGGVISLIVWGALSP